MSFLGVLAERQALFQPPPKADIGVNDAHAWRLNPNHRHVYNKLNLALEQKLRAAPCGSSPLDHGLTLAQSIFIKPIINLSGMSIGAYHTTVEEYLSHPKCQPGSFWCEYVTGEQTSTDCLLLNGKIQWFGHTSASNERNVERPVYWLTGVDLSHKEGVIRDFVEQQLTDYTGICNLEQIGDTIIEMHLRGSNGFFDFYGERFIASWVKLVDEGRYEDPGKIQQGCIYSVFQDHALVNDISSIIPSHGVSIREDQSDTNRRAIIYANSIEQAENMAQQLRGIPLP